MRAIAGRRLVLGVCGGIAAYKAAYLARALVREGAAVTPVMTAAGTRFVTPLTLEALTGTRCLTPDELFAAGASIVHIEMSRCDGFVIAPATANTIARLANGLADDLLSAAVLASKAPVLLVPSMNTGMWENPATQANLAKLPPGRFYVMRPDDGALACGDTGAGRFPEPPDILPEVAAMLGPRDLAGKRIVVTAGPTREPVDPVRVLTNPSSGRMGVALAAEAQIRGADTVLVLGPTEVAPPRPLSRGSLSVIRVTTAIEMRDALRDALPGAHALVMAAAVADERPAKPSGTKIAKKDLPRTLDLVPNPDLLVTLRPDLAGKVVLGFAAETGDLEAGGRRKLEAKGLDLLFANPVGNGKGFGDVRGEGVLLGRDGTREDLAPMAKTGLAEVLMDRVSALLARQGLPT
jgi:phosphopantothenoylcysteine decarboxylase/phosphopantothenate--cysteine ligase